MYIKKSIKNPKNLKKTCQVKNFAQKYSLNMMYVYVPQFVKLALYKG